MHLTNSNVSSSSYSNKVITDPHHLASQCRRVLHSRNITQQNENIFTTGIICLKAVWHWTSQYSKIFKYYQTQKEWLKNYQHYLTFTKVEFLKHEEFLNSKDINKFICQHKRRNNGINTKSQHLLKSSQSQLTL